MTFSPKTKAKTDKRSLPDGWQWVKLGNICEVVTGNTPSRAEKKYYGGKIPWIKPDNLDISMYVEKSEEYLSDAGVKVARLLPSGSVLVSCIGNVGKLAIAKCPLTTNQQINSLVPKEGVDSDFLYYACRQIKPQLVSAASTALLPILNKSRFSAFEIPLPPLDEQKQIAKRLNEELSAVESARKAAEEQLELLDKLITSYLRESLETSTQKMRVGDCLVEVKKGIGETWNQYPVLGATREGVAPAKEKVGKQPHRYKLVNAGTVFYNPMRINIGSIAMIDEGDEAGITSPDYVVLKGKDGVVHSRWFYYWLRSHYGENFIKTLARGAVRERMLFNRLDKGEIEIPVYEVQVKVAEKLREIRDLKQGIESQLEEINALPSALLGRAFEGNL